MSIIARKLTQNGLEPLDFEGADSLADIASLEPDGIYDVTRIFSGCRVILLDAHFDRMERSAKMLGFDVELDRTVLRYAIRGIFNNSGYNDARLRLCVPNEDPEEILIILEEFSAYGANLPLLKRKGVAVQTQRVRRQNPLAKTIQWVKERMKFEDTLKNKPYENIILSAGGELLEGFSSNFYVIVGKELHTSRAKVLPGIARKIVFELASQSFDLVDQPINIDQIGMIDEAFLTSSSRGIVPIVQIDKVVIGDGKPGPGTKNLMRSYNEWVEAHLEPI